jgi:hypothetical protein
MALPGLNTQGTRVSVMPQYTPSNTALDLSALGAGLSQGMQIVGQAQQARRLRDIMAEDQARRPLRDLLAEAQAVETQDSIALAPELSRVRALETARRGTLANLPIENVQYSFTSPTDDGGLGRFEVVDRIDPRTGALEQVNTLREIVASPDDLAIAAAKREADAIRAAGLAQKTQAEIAKLNAEAEYMKSGGSASRGKIGRGEVYQRTIEKTAGELGITPAQAERIYSNRLGPQIIAKLKRAQGEFPGDKDRLTPDEEAVLMSSYSEPASPAPSVNLSVNMKGLPVFATEDEFNAAYDAGLVKVGDRVSLAGREFDVQE